MESVEAPLTQEDHMSDPIGSQFRYKLVLGKFRVSERTAGAMKVELGGSTTMTVTIPEHADVRAGDLITLYTEVLRAQSS